MQAGGGVTDAPGTSAVEEPPTRVLASTSASVEQQQSIDTRLPTWGEDLAPR